MSKWWLLGLLFLSVPVKAANLTGFWYTDSTKIPKQQFYPNGGCSSCTITRVWDGTSIKQYSAQGQTIGGALYLLNGSGSNVTNAMVQVSSLTCAGGTGIVSVAVSSMNVMDTTTRPTQLFLAYYVQMLGLSDLPYGHVEYNESIYPPRFRTSDSLWASRPDHDTFYPVGLVPLEEFSVSSFTVAKGSSTAVWIDTYVSSSILAGNCTGTVTVYEGSTVSTSIPYIIKVYGFQMPTAYSFPATVNIDGAQVDRRFNGASVDTAGRRAVNQMLHAHGFSSTMGDHPDVTTSKYPSTEYQAYLSGTAYGSALGYGNARGQGVGQKLYMIGTYQSEGTDPDFSSTNASLFCNYWSSWSVNMGSYSGVRVAGYFADEASSTTMVTTNEKWATWLATQCTLSGSPVYSWVTGSVPTVKTYAPHVNMPISNGIFGYDPNHPYPAEANYSYTPTTWQVAADNYLTVSTSQTWRYNDMAFGSGAVPKPEEEGFVPRMNFWAMWLKLCAPSPSPGVCKGGWFMWHGNYWNDENSAHNDNDLMNVAKTFGYDAYPSTSSQWGHNGFNYTQGDGVLLWPGKDDIYTANSFGFHGPIAVWPLKMIRRGIDDADVMNLAAQINLNTTTTTVRGLISQALWEVPCTDYSDCTYNNTTDRTWSYDPNAYTTAMETLYQLVESAVSSSVSMSGGVKMSGTVKIGP